MRTPSARLILFLAMLGTACSQSRDDHGLDAARKRWAAHLPGSYSFTRAQRCECLPDQTRPIRISVTAGQITSAVYVDDQRPVSDQVRGTLLTIDGVFDQIQDAIDRDAAEITIAFDPTLGYPTAVFVDYSRQIADEELILEISDLTAT
jgi:hypothetical protein